MKKEREIVETIKVYLRKRPFIREVSSAASSSSSKGRAGIAFNDEEDEVGNIDTAGIESIAENHKSCSYNPNRMNSAKQQFFADYIFEEKSKQADLYETVAKPVVESCLEGYSGVILAYGQTASGKTYTMRGKENDNRGIIPRCIEHLLSVDTSKKGIELWASYFQIYCEAITDLLTSPDPLSVPSSGNNSPYYSTSKLTIREKSDNSGVYVDGLSKQKISSLEDLWEILLKGDSNRFTAATNMNEQSSRSHAVLMLSVVIPDESEEKEEGSSSKEPSLKSYKEGKLLLIDLAGSERAKASEGRDSMRLEEAKAINLSLSSLGNCMNALAEGKSFIPYRDSKLTRLLTNCLGGTSRTSLIVNVLPDNDITGETLNALRFAARASKVKVNAKISKIQNYEMLYKELLGKLQNEGTTSKDGNGSSFSSFLADKSKDYTMLLKEKADQIEKQEIEIELLKQQIQSLQQENQLLLGSTNNSSSSLSYLKTGTPSFSANLSVPELQQQLESLTKEHLQAMNKQHSLYQRKMQEKDNTIYNLTKEQSSLQESLFNEKEQHWKTIQEMKKIHENSFHSENLFQTRLDDCLTNINSLKNDLENANLLISSLQQEKLIFQRKEFDYQQQIKSMVSHEQVKEMEMLFMETITRLSERVQNLETQKTSSVSNNSSGKGPPLHPSYQQQSQQQRSFPPVNKQQSQQSTSRGMFSSNTSSKDSLMTSETILSSLANANFGANHEDEDDENGNQNESLSSDRIVRIQPGKIRPNNSNNYKI
jgi:hypothetical protein